MLTLKKFTKMRDDAMMIRISVKIARMYVNGFNTPKDNCLNSGIWILFILTREIIFYLKISNFHFSEKKNPGNSTKVLEKNAGLLYKSLRRGKLFRLTLRSGSSTEHTSYIGSRCNSNIKNRGWNTVLLQDGKVETQICTKKEDNLIHERENTPSE